MDASRTPWQITPFTFKPFPRPLWNHMKCRRGPRVLTPGDESILDDPMFSHLQPPDKPITPVEKERRRHHLETGGLWFGWLPCFFPKKGISKTEKHAAITPETSSCDTVTLFASFGMHGHSVNITDTCPVRHFRRLWRLDASAPWNDLSIFFLLKGGQSLWNFWAIPAFFNTTRGTDFWTTNSSKGEVCGEEKIQWCRVRSPEFAHNSAGETSS